MKKYPWYHVFVYAYTLPVDLLGWLAVLLIWVIWGTKLHWLEGLWCELKAGSWPHRTWYKKWGATTFGHGGFLAPGLSGGPGMDTKTEYHESVHVDRYESVMLLAFAKALAVGLTLHFIGRTDVGFIVGAILWSGGSIFSLLCNWFVAVLRGEDAYGGSIHEESAYALTEKYARGKLVR